MVSRRALSSLPAQTMCAGVVDPARRVTAFRDDSYTHVAMWCCHPRLLVLVCGAGAGAGSDMWQHLAVQPRSRVATLISRQYLGYWPSNFIWYGLPMQQKWRPEIQSTALSTRGVPSLRPQDKRGYPHGLYSGYYASQRITSRVRHIWTRAAPDWGSQNIQTSAECLPTRPLPALAPVHTRRTTRHSEYCDFRVF